MVFEEIGNISIETLNLNPDYDLEACLGQIRFKGDYGMGLLVTEKKKVFLECEKTGTLISYEGVCSDEELATLERIYGGGEEHV